MAGLHSDVEGEVVMALRPSGRVQNLSIGASSVQSAPFTAVNQNTSGLDTGLLTSLPTGTTHVRLVATTDCWVAFGTNPTASSTSGSILLPANSVEYFPVDTSDLIAVIQNASAGTLNISECE